MTSEESCCADGESKRRHKAGKLCWKKSNSSNRWRPVADASAFRTVSRISFNASCAARPVSSSSANFCLWSRSAFNCSLFDESLLSTGRGSSRGGKSFITPVASHPGRLTDQLTR